MIPNYLYSPNYIDIGWSQHLYNILSFIMEELFYMSEIYYNPLPGI